MTQEELAEIMAMAGADIPNRRADEKDWADKQITNVPVVANQLPEPSIDDFQMAAIDQPIIDTANRLNSLLGNDFTKDMKIERLQ